MAEFAYSSTWVQICNRALGMLAAGSIQSLTESTALSNYCLTFLADAIESVLGQYTWNACRTRVQLAQDSEAPEYEYDYAYRLPTDYVNLIHVECGEEEYQIEFPYILTNAEEVYITYIHRPTDPNEIPSYIRKAISSALALLLTIPLSSNENTAARVAQLAQAHLTTAKDSDVQGVADDSGEDFYYEGR